ncbi:hypothetical protein [Massilia frigida]|nr:hypothetical protein [Massilia frigida]
MSDELLSIRQAFYSAPQRRLLPLDRDHIKPATMAGCTADTPKSEHAG